MLSWWIIDEIKQGSYDKYQDGVNPMEGQTKFSNNQTRALNTYFIATTCIIYTWGHGGGLEKSV